MTEIHFLLTLRGPLMLSIPGGDPNSNATLTHIPGSVVRGALAGRYVAQQGETDPDFAHHFLSEETLFLPAYPVQQGQPTRPTPRSWQYEKERKPDEEKPELIDQLVKNEPTYRKAIADKNPFTPAIAQLDKKDALPHAPAVQVAVHTTRDRNMGRATEGSGALFQYEALAEGQTFLGRIRLLGNASTADFWQPFLEKNGRLFMGGSHTAGYGLVQLHDVHPREVSLPSTPISTPFNLYLLSEAMIRHPKTGQNGPYLEAYLQHHLGSDLKLEEGYASQGWRGGFNQKWGLPLPQQWVYTAGSIWRVTSDNLNQDKLAYFLQHGLGERRTEGFGQILVNPDWATWLKPISVAEEKAAESELDEANLKFVTRIKKNVQIHKLEPQLLATAQALTEGVGRYPSNSQMGQLKLLLRRGIAAKELTDFRIYLAGTRTRQQVNEEYRKARLKKNNLNFREWLERLAQEPALVWQELGLEKKPAAELEDLFYAARLMELVCSRISESRRQSDKGAK